jgi:hypothetical protein
MSSYSIGITIALPPDIPFGPDTFQTLAGAVAQMAQDAKARWLAYAQGEPLPNGQVIGVRSGTYHRSIQLEQIGPFHYRVFSNLAYAEAIETGSPERDMKKMLDSSLKVRRTKDGKRYLIIPFRWGTPDTVTFGNNTMPKAVHDFFKPQGVARSRIISLGRRESGTGAYDIKTRQPVLVPRRQYEWGTRLTQQHLGAMGIGTQFKGKNYKTHPMAGMTNFRKPDARGGKAHSKYLTFRVMTEDSTGWKAPAIPGKYPAKTVAEMFKPIAEQAFKKALEEDVRNYLGQVRT